MEKWSNEIRTTFDSDELDGFFENFEPLDTEELLAALPDPLPDSPDQL